jgi:hypothetical protein
MFSTAQAGGEGATALGAHPQKRLSSATTRRGSEWGFRPIFIAPGRFLQRLRFANVAGACAVPVDALRSEQVELMLRAALARLFGIA